tara:strand:+ start:2511 stop:2789 length:279 start_codon:yes stop_codon:yes gene_type:complete
MKNLEKYMDDKIVEMHESIKYHKEKLIDEEKWLVFIESTTKEEGYNYKLERARKDVEWRKEQIQSDKYMLDILYTARDCKADNGFNYQYSVT